MTDRSGTGEASTRDPQGPAAEIIDVLWQFLLWSAVVTFVVTMVWLAIGVMRRREGAMGERFVVWWGLVLPSVVLVGLMGVLLWTGEQVYRPNPDPELTIDVVGHQFWWEIDYGGEAVTANEVHIPAGQPVELNLYSEDVIHSFWVPELHGKTDMVPGRENTHWIEADEPGVYRGFCAEFCGLAHAQMLKIVVAQEPDEFEAWLERQRQPAPEPDEELTAEGQEVFQEAGCISCHAIRGVGGPEADPGDDFAIGPDLTHFAGRETLGAGIARNTRGELGGWIMDPQANKPGVAMPPSDLDGDELMALLAYLETLE